MTSIVLKSPAKINLFLNVLNKRADGYHNIQTVFERVNLFDDISITLKNNNKVSLICDHLDLPKDKRNLAYQVALCLKAKFKIKHGFDISIKKRIPIAAGLGGGSSNAACVLEGINRLLALGLSRRQLMQYAAEIGSDVPFFLSGVSFAWADGRGERILPLDIQRQFWHVLVVPKLRLLTRKIYSQLDKISGRHKLQGLTKKNISVKMWATALEKKDLLWIENNCFNSLEAVAVRAFREIGKIKGELKELGFKVVLMSGSGPSMFGMVSSRKEAVSLCKRLKSIYNYQTYVLKTY